MLKKLIQTIVLSAILSTNVFATSYTVSQTNTIANHGDLVVLSGKITKHTGYGEYILNDGTGDIFVYIPYKEWHENNMLANKLNTNIELTGYLVKLDTYLDYNTTYVRTLRIKPLGKK